MPDSSTPSENPNPSSSSGKRSARSRSSRSNQRAEPNYAARRMIVSTIGITVVVVAAIVAWGVVGGNDGDGDGDLEGWDEIALVGRADGAVTLVDGDGEPIDDSADEREGQGRVLDAFVDADRLALIGPNQLVLTDLDDDDVVVPFARDSIVERIPTTEGFRIGIGEPGGGNIEIVDGSEGTVLDVGDLAGQSNPLFFTETIRTDLTGTVFAVADAANFQTVLVRPDSVEAEFYPDQPLAVSDELVATSQVVGRRADIALFDRDGSSLTSAPTQIPVGGVIDDGKLVFVSVDGGVFELGPDDEEAVRLGIVAVPANGSILAVHPTAGGNRLVVAGDVFEAVIELDGTTVFTTTFTTPVDIGNPDPTWTCLPVGGTDDDSHSLIDLDTGEQLADLSGLDVTGTSSDGCTVIGLRDELTEIVTTDATVRLGTLRSAALGPDGRSVVTETTSGDVELVRIDDEFELTEPVDLTDASPINAIVAFLTD